MPNKTLNSRIIIKHDLNENWKKATNFKPMAGEIVIYDDLKKMKIGNGTDMVTALPFVNNIEGYYHESNFYLDSNHTDLIPGSTNVIYLDLATEKLYRYNGAYIQIKENLGTVGANNTPIYLDNGTFTASSYQLNKTVPADAEFTDDSVTSEGCHYSPEEDAASKLVASGATGTAGTTVQVISAIKRDTKGHVVGIESAAVTDTLPNDGALKLQLAGTPQTEFTANSSTDVTINITSESIGAMKFIGETSTDLTDNCSTNPITIGTESYTAARGNLTVTLGTVATWPNTEFMWDGAKWLKIGDNKIYKTVQEAKQDPTVGDTPNLEFIQSISQNTNGEITATKQSVKDMVGATSSKDGAHGLVPQPLIADKDKFLRGDGTWTEVDTSDKITNPATKEADDVLVYDGDNWIAKSAAAITTAVRSDITIQAESSTINIPSAITSQNSMMVYLNGLLLIRDIHYTVSTNVITLVGFTVKVGDLVTLTSAPQHSSRIWVSSYAADLVGSGDTDYNINHNLGSRDVMVQVYDITVEAGKVNNYSSVMTDVYRPDNYNVTIHFTEPQNANKKYRVLVSTLGYTGYIDGEGEDF